MLRGRLILNVPRAVQTTMLRLARENRPNETGGGLLGCWLRRNEAYICCATAAGLNARATPVTFEPDVEHLWTRAMDVHSETAGIITYLGEWHSHPATTRMRLSSTDMHTTRSIAATLGSRGSVLVVVLPDSVRLRVCAWHCGDGCLREMRVALVT